MSLSQCSPSLASPEAAGAARQAFSVIQVVAELITFQIQSSLGWEASLEVTDPTPAPSRTHFKGGSGFSGPPAKYLNLSRIPVFLFLVFAHIHFENVFPFVYLQFFLLLLMPIVFLDTLLTSMIYSAIERWNGLPGKFFK